MSHVTWLLSEASTGDKKRCRGHRGIASPKRPDVSPDFRLSTKQLSILWSWCESVPQEAGWRRWFCRRMRRRLDAHWHTALLTTILSWHWHRCRFCPKSMYGIQVCPGEIFETLADFSNLYYRCWRIRTMQHIYMTVTVEICRTYTVVGPMPSTIYIHLSCKSPSLRWTPLKMARWTVITSCRSQVFCAKKLRNWRKNSRRCTTNVCENREDAATEDMWVMMDHVKCVSRIHIV